MLNIDNHRNDAEKIQVIFVTTFNKNSEADTPTTVTASSTMTMFSRRIPNLPAS